ncbi:MAG: sulfite exporter TauE/SafE family protein [Chloroflexota bacterium]
MTPLHILILMATGLVGGFASGMLGIGGGIIMVPVQYLLFNSLMGLPTDTAIKLALGTNLAVILLTVASGAWRHSRKGAVWWRAAVFLGCFATLGSVIGATIATHLPGEVLKVALGLIISLVSLRMLISKPLQSDQEPKDNLWLWAAWAFPLGLLTGTLGIGGGALVVPVLVLVLKFPLHKAIATSLGMMLFTSAGAATSFILNGLGASHLPAYSLGYVHLPSWLLLGVSSMLTAQLGAIAAHRLPARQLTYIFVAITFYMGLKMLGVFDWLGWPL